MGLRAVIGDYAFVMKVNVTDIEKSLEWYEQKLEMKHDPRYDVPGWWAQLKVLGMPRLAWGLNKGKPVPGSDTPTFVVRNIVKARKELLSRGVAVGPIEEPGKGVKLAFFSDPDGNQLGLRQNPPSQPQEFA